MILPKKHISIEESLLGFGGYLLKYISKAISVDELWNKYLNDYNNSKYHTKFNFDQFIVTIDYLFAIGAIEMNEKGEIKYATNKTNRK